MTHERSEKNRYSRNRCDIRSPPRDDNSPRTNVYARRGGRVHKSEPEGVEEEEEGEKRAGGGEEGWHVDRALCHVRVRVWDRSVRYAAICIHIGSL